MVSRPQLRSQVQASESTQLVRQGCLFLPCYYLATSTTNWVPILTGLLFYAYVGIHQLVRRLVLDNNYQMCPVPLREKTSWDILDYSQGCCFLLVSPETEITILSFSSSLLAVSLRLTAGGRTDVFPSKPSGVSARSVAFREEKKLIKLLFPWNWWQFSIQFQI